VLHYTLIPSNPEEPKNYKVYGAVAGIKIDEKADEYATQEGLFLIEPAGDSVIIANSESLQPRVW
jgi:hypothetical protein